MRGKGEIQIIFYFLVKNVYHSYRNQVMSQRCQASLQPIAFVCSRDFSQMFKSDFFGNCSVSFPLALHPQYHLLVYSPGFIAPYKSSNKEIIIQVWIAYILKHFETNLVEKLGRITVAWQSVLLRSLTSQCCEPGWYTKACILQFLLSQSESPWTHLRAKILHLYWAKIKLES